MASAAWDRGAVFKANSIDDMQALQLGQEPADEQQKRMLKELKVKVKSKMTKAEAEALIYHALKKQGLCD